MARHARKRGQKRRSFLGCLGRLLLISVVFFGLLIGAGVVWYYGDPPFQSMSVARVLLVGLDEPPRLNPSGPRRSDTIILCAMRTDGTGATLLSVPRDAYVRLPRRRMHVKINNAYAVGNIDLLKETLASHSLKDSAAEGE